MLFWGRASLFSMYGHGLGRAECPILTSRASTPTVRAARYAQMIARTGIFRIAPRTGGAFICSSVSAGLDSCAD